MKRQVSIIFARMLGKYSKSKATREAMQAFSQSKVQIAVSAANPPIPLSSHLRLPPFRLVQARV